MHPLPLRYDSDWNPLNATISDTLITLEENVPFKIKTIKVISSLRVPVCYNPKSLFLSICLVITSEFKIECHISIRSLLCRCVLNSYDSPNRIYHRHSFTQTFLTILQE